MSSALDQLQHRLERAEQLVREAVTETMATYSALITATARGYIGEELPDWAPLAASTVATKTARGQVGRISATDPLLATGALRDSIDGHVEITDEQVILIVGSSDPVAIYHELGTSLMPARPFLARALDHHLDALTDALRTAAANATERALHGD